MVGGADDWQLIIYYAYGIFTRPVLPPRMFGALGGSSACITGIVGINKKGNGTQAAAVSG